MSGGAYGYGPNPSGDGYSNSIGGNFGFHKDISGGGPIEEDLIMEWTTANPGDTIELTSFAALTNNFDVDWGDGSGIATEVVDSPTHTYAAAGTYEVRIKKTSTSFSIEMGSSSAANRAQFTKFKNWGIVPLQSIRGMFYNCANVAYEATDYPNLTAMNPANSNSYKSMRQTFRNCTSITSLDLSGWQNTDEFIYAQAFEYVFYLASNLTLINMSNWDFSGGVSAKTFSYFAHSVGTATTGCAIVMNDCDMSTASGFLNFLRNSKVASISLNNWQLRPFASGGVAMNNFLYGTTSNAGTGDVDVNMSTWTNTDGIKSMSNWVRGADAIGTIDTTGWDTSNVTNLSNFAYTNYQLSEIKGLSGWSSASVTTVQNMFYYAYKLHFSGATSNFSATWGSNLGSCTDMRQMFTRCGWNGGGTALGPAPNVANWDITGVTGNNMTSLFQQGNFNTAVTPTNWDFSNMTGSLGGFFYDTRGMGPTIDLSTWTMPATINNMTNFARSTAATTLIFGTNCNFSGVTNMSNFGFTSALTTLTFPATVSFAACTTWVNAFTSVTLDPTSYDAILVRNDATNANTPVTLTGGSSKYTKAPSAAATARAALVTLGWTIGDGGPTP